MKKYIWNTTLIIFFCLIMFLTPAKSTPTTDVSFEYQSVVLSTQIFPEIKEFLKNLEFTEENSKFITVTVYDILSKYNEGNQICFLIPPEVEVFKLKGKTITVYVLGIKLVLQDQEESRGKFVTSFVIKKRFLIELKNQDSAEI